jgi:hypothetical protein
MIKRSLSYNIIQIADISNKLSYKTYKSCNDLVKLCKYFDLSINNIISKDTNDINLLNNSKSVSYGLFLSENSHATKKQRIQAVQRFYNKLC